MGTVVGVGELDDPPALTEPGMSALCVTLGRIGPVPSRPVAGAVEGWAGSTNTSGRRSALVACADTELWSARVIAETSPTVATAPMPAAAYLDLIAAWRFLRRRPVAGPGRDPRTRSCSVIVVVPLVLASLVVLPLVLLALVFVPFVLVTPVFLVV